MGEIDWLDSPLNSFSLQDEFDESGLSKGRTYYPHGEGEAQDVLFRLWCQVQDVYEELLPEDFDEMYETEGMVPVIRNGQRKNEPFHNLTLRDLPTILDTFVVLEEELKQRQREEYERKASERKERERIRAKERRKLKKLGEW